MNINALYKLTLFITFINAYQCRIFLNHKILKLNASKWANFTIIPRELDFHELQHILTNY